MFHKKLPSFSFSRTPSVSAQSRDDSRASSGDSSDDEGASRSRSRRRSLSPFHSRAKGLDRQPSAEGLRRTESTDGFESDAEANTPVVRPSNAFDSSDSDDDDDEDLGPEDPDLEKNTEANASERTPLDFLQNDLTMTFPGEGPNMLAPTDPLAQPVTPTTRTSRPRSSTRTSCLVTGRPVFEKNRCTVTLENGDVEKAKMEKRRTRKYLVASDLSEESLYAIQWAIGTVLRDGDECYIVSVIETDTKFDSDDKNPSSSEKRAKIANQKDRQVHASMISRQATTLLERTRLNVRVHCQAVHAKNARHMLVDMIDYFEPTLVIIGTRGLAKIKGMLLGSVSNYLIQKSSSPVMVTRRPLRLARQVHKKLSTLQRESRVPLHEADIEKESHGGEIDSDAPEPDDVKERIESLSISDK